MAFHGIRSDRGIGGPPMGHRPAADATCHKMFDVMRLTKLQHRRLRTRIFLLIRLLSATAVSPVAQADYREFKSIPVVDSLGAALTHTAEATMKEFPQLMPE